MKYRKKPEIIEAVQWFKNGDHPEDDMKRSYAMPAFMGHNPPGTIVERFSDYEVLAMAQCGHCKHVMEQHGWIKTESGGHTVCPGDFVVTDDKGQHYPIKAEIFEKTYEPAE